MGILQFFTNSFDLIWRPKLKVIKKGIKKIGPARAGPTSLRSSRYAGWQQQPSTTMVGRFHRQFQETCCFLRFQTLSYSNFYIFMNLTPSSILFVSTCSYFKLNLSTDLNLYINTQGRSLLTFSFRSPELLNCQILFHYFRPLNSVD